METRQGCHSPLALGNLHPSGHWDTDHRESDRGRGEVSPSDTSLGVGQQRDLVRLALGPLGASMGPGPSHCICTARQEPQGCVGRVTRPDGSYKGEKRMESARKKRTSVKYAELIRLLTLPGGRSHLPPQPDSCEIGVEGCVPGQAGAPSPVFPVLSPPTGLCLPGKIRRVLVCPLSPHRLSTTWLTAPPAQPRSLPLQASEWPATLASSQTCPALG